MGPHMDTEWEDYDNPPLFFLRLLHQTADLHRIVLLNRPRGNVVAKAFIDARVRYG
jgi:hypothetical protein